MKKYLYIICSLLLSLTSCGPEQAVVIPDSTESTENSLLAVSELISTFDVVEDFVSSSKLFMKRDESILPADAEIIIIDPEFEDGDGIEAIIDFGGIGLEPFGLLCKDNKYRAGKIRLSLDKPYNNLDAKLTIWFEDEDAFYSGNGKEMIKIVGSMQLKRISADELLMHCSDFTLKKEEDNAVAISADLSVVRLENNGEGLVNDKLSFDGLLEIQSLDDNLTFNIIEPLTKEYELSCAKYIKQGKINVEQVESASNINIDFDPNQDNACDNTVGINVNGRTLMYTF